MSLKITSLGNPSLPALILLHGFAAHKTIWETFAARLQPHFCVHCCDLPGYGDNLSATMPDLYSLSNQLINQLPQNAFWLGWSLGGLPVLDIALRYPDAIRGAITMGSSPCFLAQTAWPGLDITYFDAFCQNLIERPQKTVNQFQLLQVHGDNNARTVLPFLQYSSRHPVSDSAWQNSLRILQETDLRASLTSLNVPYLAILGAEDKIVPATIAAHLQHYSECISCRIIDGAAHVPFLSEPETTMTLIIEFVETLNKKSLLSLY